MAITCVGVCAAGLIAASAASADHNSSKSSPSSPFVVLSGFDRDDVDCSSLAATLVDISDGSVHETTFTLASCDGVVERAVVSPDASDLAVLVGDASWHVTDQAGIHPRSLVGCVDVSWSDDSSLIACVRTTGVVDIIVAETSHVVSQLVLPQGLASVAAFSGPTEVVISAPATGAPCSLPVDALAPRTAIWKATIADHHFERLRDLPCALDVQALDVSTTGKLAFVSDGAVFVAGTDAASPAQLMLEVIDEADLAAVAWARDTDDIIVIAPGGEAGPIVERHELFPAAVAPEAESDIDAQVPSDSPTPSEAPESVEAADLMDPGSVDPTEQQVVDPASEPAPPSDPSSASDEVDADAIADAVDDAAEVIVSVQIDDVQVLEQGDDQIEADPVVVVATLGVPQVTHTLGNNADDQEPPTIEFIGVRDNYSAGDRVNISCVATDVGTGVNSSTCQTAVGPAHAFRGLNTLTATASDAAGNTTRATVSFVVSIPADQLPLVFDELVVETPGFADALRPHLDTLIDGECSAAFSAYAAAVRDAVEVFGTGSELGADVYSLGVAICRA